MPHYPFVPRLPTAAAWNSRAFHPQATLQDIVHTMKEKNAPFMMRGQLILREWREDIGCPRTIQFSGVRDLERLLADMKWSADNISRIYLYEYGYFAIGPWPEPPRRQENLNSPTAAMEAH